MSEAARIYLSLREFFGYIPALTLWKSAKQSALVAKEIRDEMNRQVFGE